MDEQDFTNELNRIEEEQKALNARRAAVKSQVIARVQEMINTYRLTTADIRLPSPDEASAVYDIRPTKYRDEFGNTWTGRGRKPKWLLQAIERGANIDDFLVQGF